MPVDPLRRYFEGINLDQGTVLTWSKLVASNWPLSEKSDALDFVAARVRSSNLFDADFYQEQAKLDPDLDPALHYVLVGEALGLLPSKDFNPGYYAQRNPDVMRTGMNLLLHYAEYGRAEGRYGHPPLTFHRNPARFDPARENVIVVVHETSRTGAPILGWNIVQHLAARYNVFTVRLGDGALTPAFEELSAETHGPFLRTQRHTVDIENGLKPLFAGRVFRYAIVNSSESRPLVEVCARHLVPTLFLMHEFGSYVHPASSLRRAFDWAAEIVFSAPMVARASEEVHPVLRDRVNQVLPQGMSVVPPGNAPSKPLPVEKLAALASAREAGTFLVIGAGTVELRKGVDLFLAAAAAVRRSQPSRPVHFVWIGHGYRPDEDMGYSVYLKEQLQRSGLEEDVTFLGEVSDLEAVYSLADAFFLSSRLDPLPNVSIDAAHRGIPIICFEGASGTADLMLADPGTAPGVVPHLDADAAGRVIVHLASDAVACRQLAEATAQLARRIFDMAHYVDQLDALGATHVARAVRLRDDAAMLLTEGGFDPDFFQGPDSVLEERAETAALYLSRRRWDVSGARRPAPGFDPMAWAAAHPGLVADGVDPLAGFIRAGRPAGPWQSPVITPAESVTLSAERLQSVLHAHLPQAALAADLLTHLRPNALACDLLVTTDTEAKAADLRRALEAYGPGSVSVHVLPGDLLSVAGALGAKLADYDVVGHVHAGPGGAHDVWRDFQWQALLGGRHAMRDRILDAFAHMPSLGLVFPAEPHSPEWDDASHARVSTLVSRLGHTGPLPEVGGDFPVGGMVWMRGSVLQLLARLGPDGLSEGDIGRVLPVLNGMARLSHAVAHVPGVFW
jgi:glycosyltransferase involved in cell wall biosynthesis